MRVLNTILDSLTTPDNQNRDWYGWATNQMSHALLGVIVAIFFPSAPLQVILIIAVLIESIDFFRIPSRVILKDSIIDIIFWLFGGILVIYQHEPLIGTCLIAAGLLIGILPRLRKVL